MGRPDFSFEKKIWKERYKYIVGLDEVGRGALAGPVVVGGVIFPTRTKNLELVTKNLGIRIDDSKKLTAGQREKAEKWIRQNALAISVASISAKKIDRLGIVRATHSGFRRVVKSIQEQLAKSVNFILIDAFYIPYLSHFPLVSKERRQLAITAGDTKSFTIAASSIIAKVYRDKLMTSLSQKPRYKKYGWGQNKGYGTKLHQKAIKKYGLTGYHRKTFINLDF